MDAATPGSSLGVLVNEGLGLGICEGLTEFSSVFVGVVESGVVHPFVSSPIKTRTKKQQKFILAFILFTRIINANKIDSHNFAVQQICRPELT